MSSQGPIRKAAATGVASPYHDDGQVRFYLGDCREVMAGMEPDSFDAIVCDPPYELGFMGKGWDKSGVAFDAATWAEVLRVAKPGAHLVAFGGTRTWHRLACAIEDAGWEIRDTLCWMYGSGFPKSLDVSKALDKAAGAEREDKFEGSFDRRAGPTGNRKCDTCGKWLVSGSPCKCPRPQDAPQTDLAKQWDGWGTALKPAYEPIVLARKPLSGTVAANVTKWGTGGINIDGTRIGINHGDDIYAKNPHTVGTIGENGIYGAGAKTLYVAPLGRWPANVVLDEEAAALLDEQTGDLASGDGHVLRRGFTTGAGMGYGSSSAGNATGVLYGDRGGASRFFYTAKASRSEREAGLEGAESVRRSDGRAKDIENPRLRTNERKNHHPTVKPVSLMRWLCRLVTPPGGVILDPFLGSGSTAIAAKAEGFRIGGIDLSAEYLEMAKRRCAQMGLIK